MSDDGFGPYITVHFTQRRNKNVLVINAGTTPEERKGEILDFKPDLLLLVDTCSSGDPPGTIIFANEKQLVNYLPISSHTLPIQVFISILKENIVNLQVFLLGVNPISLESTIERHFYKPELYDLEDYENDPNLPFYEINLTPKVKIIADEVVRLFEGIFF
jgi:hydrogenase maturation protease